MIVNQLNLNWLENEVILTCYHVNEMGEELSWN